MRKELLLSKSNFRKNIGTSIGLFLLITLAAMLVGVSLLLFNDAYPTAAKEAKRLEAGDGIIWVNENLTGIDDSFIEEVLKNDTKEYQIFKCNGYNNLSIPFGEGTVAPSITLCDASAFDKKFDRTEIVCEDKDITKDYIYLPYQFNTSGGFELGDEFKFELDGKTRQYTVKGFTSTTFFGCNNTGLYELVLDDASYKSINDSENVSKAMIISFKLKDNVKATKFKIDLENKFAGKNPATNAWVSLLPDMISGKSFMSLILAVAFLTITTILILVIAMMLSNCITNYINENMKIIGVLKAQGYISKNIRTSLYIMFVVLAIFGGLLGASLSYALMPVMAQIVIGQMGVPYTASFRPELSIILVVAITIFVFIVSILATRKIVKIDPIVALRDGMSSHNFKKNRVRLDKSNLSIDLSLALKTMFTNKKQNIITFLVTGLLVFISVIGLLMYENFSRNPSLEILTFETCGGVVGVDAKSADRAYEFLNKREDLSNIRRIFNMNFTYNGEDRLNTYILDDVSKMNNKDVCYKGRLPQYDNEIAISGKFAVAYGFDLGDEIKMEYGYNSYNYLISGLIQTSNNNGREAVMSEEAAGHLIKDMSAMAKHFWYDCKDKESSQRIIDDFGEEMGEHMVFNLNFYETIEGSLTTFKSISAIMLILVCTISAVVIMLILYLLIKALIHKKRKDYGILKALGFTSRSLIMQTAVSFMPSIVLSIVIFSVLSFYLANPYMTIIMRIFGLMKCSFAVPIPGVILIGAGLAIIAFLFSLFQARKIKNIEAYNLLIS